MVPRIICELSTYKKIVWESERACKGNQPSGREPQETNVSEHGSHMINTMSPAVQNMAETYPTHVQRMQDLFLRTRGTAPGCKLFASFSVVSAVAVYVLAFHVYLF